MVLIGQSALRGHQITGKDEFLDDWENSAGERLEHEATFASFFGCKAELSGGCEGKRQDCGHYE
jgi:hypothetical protein